MNEPIKLRRLGRTGIEQRASIAVIFSWTTLWAAVGFNVLFWLDEWHGFFWGFILSGIASVLGTWLLFVKPSTRRKAAATLHMEDHCLTVKRNIEVDKVQINLNEPHRAMLIRSKGEGRVMFRVEQLDENARSLDRIDLIGPLPMIMPMKISGDAQSLIGFEPGVAKKNVENAPFSLVATGARALSTMTAILEYTERHSDKRNEIYNLRVKNGAVRLEKNGFVLVHDDKQTMFDFSKDFEIACQARRYLPHHEKESYLQAAVIYLALVPPHSKTRALVFEFFAPEEWMNELPTTWDIPDEAMQRSVLLYDDNPVAFVAVNALKRYIERIEPSNPVLEILRH
jgi:hypothetical protein